MDSIIVDINDTSSVPLKAPPTKLVAQVSGKATEEAVSAEAGGFTSGVTLHRGYSCTDKSLKANLTITKLINLQSNLDTKTDIWNIEVRFYTVRVQPFLVTNGIIKNPLLCKYVLPS